MDCILTLLKKLLGDHSDAVDVQGTVFVLAAIVHICPVDGNTADTVLFSHKDIFNCLDFKSPLPVLGDAAFLSTFIAESFALENDFQS